MNPQKTAERKQHKYAPLIEELVKEGWNVDPTVHAITVGVRATVPIRNVEVLENLGIKDKASAAESPGQHGARSSCTPK